jgi:hypothetical protein
MGTALLFQPVLMGPPRQVNKFEEPMIGFSEAAE